MSYDPAAPLPPLKKNQTLYDLSGTWIVLKKVDLNVLGVSGLEQALRGHLVELGFKNAEAGGERYATSEEDFNPRPQDLEGEGAQKILAQIGQLRLAAATNKLAITGGLVYPPLEALIDLYGGSLELDDYGMGPDFSELAQAILNHSRGVVSQLSAEEAERFPEDVRGIIGQLIREVQGAAPSVAQVQPG